MKLLTWILCIVAAVLPTSTENYDVTRRSKRETNERRVVCYYTNWSVYRPGSAKFSPQNINPYLCTHLVYAFGGLTKDNGLKPFDKYQDVEQGGYAKFNGLKTYNKKLKTLLAIGGWNEGSARFSPLVADSERRRELVKNTIKFLRQNHFDGLDLDWEYPSFRDGGKPRDRDNYATFVQELREEFDRESEKTGRSRLLLTMAVPAGIDYIDKGYDVPKLDRYLDWMNILSYDYHSAFEPTVDHHAPLFSSQPDDEYNFDSQLSIDATVQHYIQLGAEKNKLVVGIPTYGRSYTLFNPDATDLGSPSDGPGEQGDATREKGYLAYYEICEKIKAENWTVQNLNPDAVGPFAYKDNQWVGYDDESIVRAKAKYVNDNDLGGIMFWSIDNDDFRGKCHGKQYPLIEAAKETLLATSNEIVTSKSKGQKVLTKRPQASVESTSPRPRNRKGKPKLKTSTTQATTTTVRHDNTVGQSTTTPQPPTTPDPGSDFVCKDEGFFPHPRDCKKYFWCLDSGPSSLGIVAHQFTCPSGLVFNKISDSCDYPRNVICKNKVEEKTTTTTTTKPATTIKSSTPYSSRVITASPPRTTTTTTTTTTTEEPEYEEYEDEDEEDPGTIKELIGLIKRLGGVEQLEKQLNIQESDGKTSIKPSLYSKVLSGKNANNRFRDPSPETSTSRYVSLFRNRPASPQSSGDDSSTSKNRNHDKPKYVTIQRNRPQTTEDTEEVEDEDYEDEAPKNTRTRTNVDESKNQKQYVTLRRQRPNKNEDVSTPRYQNIHRTRSTTTESAEEEAEDVGEEEIEEEEVEEKPKRKYSSVIRDNKRIIKNEDEEVGGRSGDEETSKVSQEDNKRKTVNRNPVYNVNKETGAGSTSLVYKEIRREKPNVNNVNSGKDVVSTTVSDQLVKTRRGGNRYTTSTENVKIHTPSRAGTSLSTTEQSSPRKYQFATRSRPNVLNKTPTQEPITLVFPETTTLRETEETLTTMTRPDLTTVTEPIDTTITETETTEATPTDVTETNLPTTVFGYKKMSTSTETRVVTSVTESGITERMKIMVTKKPLFRTSTKEPKKKVTVKTTTTPATTTSTTTNKPFTARTRGILRRYTTPLTTDSQPRIERTRRGRISQVSTTPTTTTTEKSERKKFVPKKTRGNRKYSDLPTDEEGIGDQELEQPREKTDEVRKYQRGRNDDLRPRGRTVETKEDVRFRGRTVESKEDQRSRGRTVESNEDLKLRGRTVESNEEQRTRGRTNDDQKLNKDKRTESSQERYRPRFRTSNRFTSTEPSTTKPTRRPSRRFREDLDTQQSKTFYDDDFDEGHQQYLLGASVRKTSGQDYLNADLLFVTVPSTDVEENELTTLEETTLNPVPTPTTAKIFRGRVKAASSLLDVDESGGEVVISTTQKPTSTLFRRTNNQEFLSSLRSRTRSTTTTTSEKPTTVRRPAIVQAERRRKFRPDFRSTTENLQEVSSSPRSIQFPRRRTRPTSTTTSTTPQPDVSSTTQQTPNTAADSNVDETKESTAPELPDLANPAVVAIHNLATVSPGPSSRVVTTPSSPISGRTLSQADAVSLLTTHIVVPSTVHITERSRTLSTVPASLFTSSLGTDGRSDFTTRNDIITSTRKKEYTNSRRTTERTTTTTTLRPSTRQIQNRKLKPFSKVPKPGVVQPVDKPSEALPPVDYEYYDDIDPLADIPQSALKVKVHSDGYIECLDRGNFPHPFSCKKFISCAKMENNELLGWEYTCPKHLSFDPVGGICNWSAGLGCQS